MHVDKANFLVALAALRKLPYLTICSDSFYVDQVFMTRSVFVTRIVAWACHTDGRQIL